MSMDGAAPSRTALSPVRPVLAASAGTTLIACLVVVTWRSAPFPWWVWAPVQAAGLSFLLCGAVLWARRPGDATGALMVVVGLTWYLGDLQLFAEPVLYALGFSLFYLHTAAMGHLVLALPTGRLRHRYERRLLAVIYTAPVATQLARLVAEYPPEPQAWGDRDVPYSVWADVGSITLLALLLTVVAILLHRWVVAGAAVRREYALVWLTLVAMGAAGTALAVAALLGHPRHLAGLLGTSYALGMVVLPIAIAVGLGRIRLARLRVADLVVTLQTVTTPDQLRTAIARALRDPALEIRYPRSGGPGTAPRGRLLVPVGAGDRPVAVLVVDAGLASHRPLVDAVVAATRLALDNARLGTEQRAALAEARATAARIAGAADDERRRIQRDLHDGVQHELLALSMLVRRAQDTLSGHQIVTADLDLAARRLPEVVTEVRNLTEGIYLPVLAEQGLAAALDVLAERAAIPVLVDAPARRWPEQVERTAYFVVAEALSNVYKHAHAGHARVRVAEVEGRLTVSVADDGIGGADATQGTGLRGLRDRVTALAGVLRVSSAPGAGTTVTAELPCAS